MTNTLTSMLTALEAGSPMLVIAGEAPVARWDQSRAQAVAHLPLVSAASKWARTVLEPARIPEYVGTAYREALAGRPGPVFLDIPGDVMYGQAQPAPQPGSYRTAARAWPDPPLVRRAAKLLVAAERRASRCALARHWESDAAPIHPLRIVTTCPRP